MNNWACEKCGQLGIVTPNDTKLCAQCVKTPKRKKSLTWKKKYAMLCEEINKSYELTYSAEYEFLAKRIEEIDKL